MRFLSLRTIARIAGGCLALGCAPALMAENETLFLDAGTFTVGSSGDGNFAVTVPMTVIIGCDVPMNARVSAAGGAQVTVPPKAAGKNYSVFLANPTFSRSRGAIATNGVPKDFELKQTTGAVLWNVTNSILDTQQIDITVKAKFVYGSGAANASYTAPMTYLSLKEGGPINGRSRLPKQVNPQTPVSDPGYDWNVATDSPEYYIDEQGRVVEPPAPTYDVQGKKGDWGTGVNWHQVTAPAATGVPTWAPPNSAVITDQDGKKWVVSVGGRNGFTPGGGNVSYPPGGSPQIFVYPPGNPAWGNNYKMPMNPRPKKDFMPPKPETPAEKPIDPCFTQANTDYGLPGEGEEPEGPTNPNSGTPEPTTPTLPGSLTGGSGSGGGGSGGSGGGGSAISGPGAGGTNPKGGGTGRAPLTGGNDGSSEAASLALPDDGAAQKWADEVAKNYAKSAGELQEAAKPLMGWASVPQFNPGIAGDWVINLSVGGQSVAMTIPTSHAPLIRGVLLLLIKAAFVLACFRVLLS